MSEPKIRLCFLADGEIYGGVATALRIWSDACVALGFEVYFVWTSPGCTQREYAARGYRSATLDIGAVPASSKATGGRRAFRPSAAWWWIRTALGYAQRLRRLLRGQRIDVIFCTQFYHHLLGGCAARLAGTPCIWRVPNTMSARLLGGLALKAYSLLGYLLASRVICVSQAVARQFSPVCQPKVQVLYNAHPDHPSPPPQRIVGLRSEMGAGPGDVVIGLVTRISENKGIDVYLAAARALRNKRRDVKFVVVGGPTNPSEQRLMDDYQAYCHEHGLLDTVSFLGYRSDVRDLYFAMDVVCSCSLLTEGINNTIIEAMASGRATVVSRCGGQPELVEPGRTGLIYTPGDVPELAGALEQFVEDPERREWAGTCARQRFLEHFEAGRLTTELETLFRGLLRH